MSAPDVVVAVGTDHHPFDRVVHWADEWAVANPDASVFVQYGTSTAPLAADGAELVPHGELMAMFHAASVVVTHGGPATIMDARRAGRVPIVVARDPRRGEHVDDHQQLFTVRLATAGQVVQVDDGDAFVAALQAGTARPDTLVVDDEVGGVHATVERIAWLVHELEAHVRSRRFPYLLPLGWEADAGRPD